MNASSYFDKNSGPLPEWILPNWSALQQAVGQLVQNLENCQQRRVELLAVATQAGYSAESVRELIDALPAAGLPPDRRRRLQLQVRRDAWHWELLRHQALANWLLLQRTLLHLAQMLEIIATGGHPVPTYSIGSRHSDSAASGSGGILIDQEI